MTLDQYEICHSDKIIAHNGNEFDKIIFIKNSNIFSLIISNIDLLFTQNSKFRDLIKGITTIILIKYDKSNNQEYYTKKGAAKLLELIPIFNNSEINSLYYLFRGNEGIRDDNIFKLITDEFISICDEYITQLNIDINFLEIEHINSRIQQLFWESPCIPSPEFIEYFKEICQDYKIEKHFSIPSCKLTEIENFEELINKSYLVSQRFPEWFELRKKYISDEKNGYTDLDHTWVNKLFHLIVGSIGERDHPLLYQKICDFLILNSM